MGGSMSGTDGILVILFLILAVASLQCLETGLNAIHAGAGWIAWGVLWGALARLTVFVISKVD